MKPGLENTPYREIQSEGPTPTGTRPRFTVIVPVYNEEEALAEAIVELRRTLASEENYELIVVNDGSTDRSAEILSALSATDRELIVADHDSNSGYGSALKTGIRLAKADLIVITDADGTYPNARIGELVSLMDRYEMVVGSRTANDAEYPLIRKIPKLFLKAYASWIAGRDIPDLNSGMRVFRRDLAERFLHMLPDSFSFTTTITLAHLTNRYRVHFLPIGCKVRKGRSKIKPIRDTMRFVQLIARMGMYFAPLRVLSPFIILMLIAFLLSLGYDVLVLRNLTDKTIMFLLFGMTTALFALLADMIDKRSRW